MTKAEKKTSETMNSSNPMSVFGTNPFGDAFAESWIRAGQNAFENAFSVNQEVARFAGERFQADAAVLQALFGCATPQDAVAVQSDFLRSTTEAYQQETNMLLEQGMRAASETSEMISDAVSSFAGGIPKG